MYGPPAPPVLDRRSVGGLVPPTIEELRSLSAANHFTLSDEECHFFYHSLKSNLDNYRYLNEQPDVPLPTKYPRLPGHRPRSEENPLNAWYWKTDIKGAEGGRLQGKTVAVKDSVGVCGVPYMIGSALLEGAMGHEDATVVTRMLDEGAVIKGKST